MSNNHTGNIQPTIDLEEHQGNLNAKRTVLLDASGNQITDFGGSGSAAYSDSGGTDRKGLVDSDRHVQTDVVGALPAGTNNIGDVDIASIAAGDNNIGNVDVVTLPALPSGTNNIGDVDVLTLPVIPSGSNTIGSVKITDGTDTAEVNTRADGKVALEVADDMTSFESFTQALVASTDTTFTFAQSVRLIRVKNNSTSSVIYVRDGAISSDTPSNAELIGVAADTNLPNTEYYPFVGTTIHLRSAGTPTVSVTGFY